MTNTQIKKDLKEVLDYVVSKMYGKLGGDTLYEYEETDSIIKYVMESRSMDYYEMSHMSATDDMQGSIEYYEENLPSHLQNKIDGISGSIGEKGYFEIYTYKLKG